MIEHLPPTPATQKHVLAAAGNECAFPACSRLIFDLEHETLIGTVAHIRARREGGPRFDRTQTEEKNRSFANLLGMCAEHSKIIDGPKWRDFSEVCLETWKSEQEQKVAKQADRNWIKPANSVTKLTAQGEQLHFSYWVDQSGRAQLFRPEQLAIVNALMSLNLLFLKLGSLPGRLEESRKVDVSTVLQQEWARFDAETSVIADFSTLMAMAHNVTFAEFLGFMAKGNDPTTLIQEGARRISSVADGFDDPIIKQWYKSDSKFTEK